MWVPIATQKAECSVRLAGGKGAQPQQLTVQVGARRLQGAPRGDGPRSLHCGALGRETLGGSSAFVLLLLLAAACSPHMPPKNIIFWYEESGRMEAESASGFLVTKHSAVLGGLYVAVAGGIRFRLGGVIYTVPESPL